MIIISLCYITNSKMKTIFRSINKIYMIKVYVGKVDDLDMH